MVDFRKPAWLLRLPIGKLHSAVRHRFRTRADLLTGYADVTVRNRSLMAVLAADRSPG